MRIPLPEYVLLVLLHPPLVLAADDPELPTDLPMCVKTPRWNDVWFYGKRRQTATHMQEFHSTLSPQATATVTTRHHIKSTLQRGHCGKLRGSFTVGTVNPPSSLLSVRRVQSSRRFRQHFFNAYDLIQPRCSHRFCT